MAGEFWDILHDPGRSQAHWSTDNVGEAAPGVLTPFSWSMWGKTGDSMPRRIAHRMGVFSDEDLTSYPLIVRPFYGRIAMRMEYLAAVGDRMPGASGADIVANMFGRVPETMTFEMTNRRYPVIAYKLPHAMITAPRAVRREAPIVDGWWRTEVARMDSLQMPAAVAALREAVAKFDHMLTIHSLALLSVVQPLLVELTKLVETTGIGEVGALSGTGGAEMAIVRDIWNASRGAGSVADVVANHGFHGPLEGEAASRVWREDPTPLERMVEGYTGIPESDSPVLREQLAKERLPALQRQLLAAIPPARRPAARALLKISARMIPLRGVGKRSFLQSLDVARCAGRRIGALLTDDGKLEHADDVFYLTVDELSERLAENAAELVGLRRERREEYQQLELPGSWHGTPPAKRHQPDDHHAPEEVITGIGASSGNVEGIVRVVHDPTFAEVEPDEILVTATTDPSWASIMFLSSALVVDIGGALSHAAVVARELGIPCVVNTRNGTRNLRSGDRVRVDGTSGTVTVIQRAGASTELSA
jgi:phosphohistidine swiveling domain-containing protein